MFRMKSTKYSMANWLLDIGLTASFRVAIKQNKKTMMQVANTLMMMFKLKPNPIKWMTLDSASNIFTSFQYK